MSDEVVSGSVAPVDAVEAVEVEAEKVETSAPEVPSRDSLMKDHGWSAEEADKAVSRGVAVKEAAPVVQAKEVAAEAPKAEKKAIELSPEEEADFKRIFGPGTRPHGLYVGMKVERSKRQQAEREAAQLRAEFDAFRKQSESQKAVNEVREVDENGNEIDPEDRPLTLKAIREMQREQMEEQSRKEREMSDRASVLNEAHKAQEEYAREILPDFEDTVKLAGDIAANMELIADPIDRKEAMLLMRQFQANSSIADRLGDEDLTPAEIAYKLGKLHPKYGIKTDGKEAENKKDGIQPEIDPNKGNGGQRLTPDQMERMKANTQRRASSASIPGSGARRTVSPEDVTIADLNRMPAEQRQRFKDKHPDQFARLRG